MAFADFSFPQVRHDLGLDLREADLFADAPPAELRPYFREQIDFGAKVGRAINTEKARSEFMIAPVLLEPKWLVGDRLAIFSGVALNGDAARGLSGVCDFVLTASGKQYEMIAPLVAVAEAKNDNLLSGLGQCISAMAAARLVNEREGQPDRTVYGVVTTGSAWKFLRLAGSELTIGRAEHYIDDVGRILGVLRAMVGGALDRAPGASRRRARAVRFLAGRPMSP